MNVLKNRIESITVQRHIEDSPDLSFLGEYSRLPGENAIDRRARGDMGQGELQYCNVTMSAADTGNPDSVEQDYQRLEAYNRGDWCMIGIRATAKIVVNRTCQTIKSGGLWGVESDSPDYHVEVAREQLEELAETLKELGFTAKQIKAAIPKQVELVDA